MSKKNGVTAAGTKQHTASRKDRKTFAITQKGIRNEQDLSAFLTAAISDVDAGRADLQEMGLMSQLSGQIIALQNTNLKAALLAGRGQAPKQSRFFLNT